VTQPLRVALLGYGLAGRVFHAPLLDAEPGLTLGAVVTRDPERVAQLRADRPDVTVLSDAGAVWAAAEDYDLVVVATGNADHVRSARAALEAGLHVVVDKPLAGTADEARALVALAADRGRQLHVFQNRRWDSDVLTVQRLQADGVLGRVHRLESRFERWRPVPQGGWREDGPPDQLPGLLYDLGAHLVDQALLLLGPVRTVFAVARSVRRPDRPDDDTQVVLGHTSGAVSLLWASAVSAFTTPRMRVLGTAGGYQVDALDGQEEALRAGGDPSSPDWGTVPERHWGTVVSRGSDGQDTTAAVPSARGAWPRYYAAVVAAVVGQGAPPVDPLDVVADLRVIEAAASSAATGQVVHLEPPAGHGS
jgi:predicted dehydrogenase